MEELLTFNLVINEKLTHILFLETEGHVHRWQDVQYRAGKTGRDGGLILVGKM